MFGRKQLHENFSQRPDIAAEIQRTLVDDVRMAGQQFLEGRPGAIQFGIEETGKFVVDFNLKLTVVTLDDQNVIQDQMGDEVTDAVKAFQDGGNPVKELESQPVVLKDTGCD